jgi:hypothetical protein
MKKLMQILLLRLFGHKPVTNLQISIPKFNSIYPDNRPSEQEWMAEFKFGMLWDRKVIHID